MKKIYYFLFIPAYVYSANQNINMESDITDSQINQELLLPPQLCKGLLPYGNPAASIFRNPLETNQEYIENFNKYYGIYYRNLLILEWLRIFHSLWGTHIYCYFLITYIVLMINQEIVNSFIYSILFTFLLPIVILLVGMISTYFNRMVFFIKQNDTYILENREERSLWKESLKQTGQNWNYFLYKIQPIFSSYLNIFITLLEVAYVITKFLALFQVIDLPTVLGVDSIYTMSPFYKLTIFTHILLESILLIWYSVLWKSIKSIRDISCGLYDSLNITKNSDIIFRFIMSLISC